MPKYLVQSTYAAEGTQGLMQEGGSGRRKAVDAVVGSLGGSVEALYFAYGENDVLMILEFPDHVSMAAVSMAAKASGAVQSTKATPLLTVEEIDEAARKKPAFRPPGA